jgi:membrane protease YdiL (CAAX protease family)
MSFGLAAGFLEELGWTGYALPRMMIDHKPLKTGLVLGIFWGLWHLPVIDFLGAASPHGAYLIPFMAAFIAAMTAMRMIMTWVYSHVRSVALAQMMHIISTGSLVAFGPFGVTAAQETTWYTLYAVALWGVIALIALARRGTKKPSLE